MRERALALRRRRLFLLLELEMSKMADEKVMGAPANGGAEDGMLAGGELSSAETRVRPLETLLRAAPLGLCVAAMAVMLRDTQTNEYGTVSYSDLGGFKYVSPYSVLPLPPCSRIGSCRVLIPFVIWRKIEGTWFTPTGSARPTRSSPPSTLLCHARRRWPAPGSSSS